MKLIILRCKNKLNSSYLVSLKYGEKNIEDIITIHEGVVPYIEYSDRLQDILHKDVGEAKKMNKVMFKIYRSEEVVFPFEVGEF